MYTYTIHADLTKLARKALRNRMAFVYQCTSGNDSQFTLANDTQPIFKSNDSRQVERRLYSEMRKQSR